MVKFDSQKIEYQLKIDSEYYNTLDIVGFSRMMKDPSYCYKFYWLEAIVQLISQDKKEATYDEIINEMIRKLYESCYRDNLHSIWASQEFYRKGNSREAFYGILERNMRPVYDSARRQGYEIWMI